MSTKVFLVLALLTYIAKVLSEDQYLLVKVKVPQGDENQKPALATGDPLKSIGYPTVDGGYPIGPVNNPNSVNQLGKIAFRGNKGKKKIKKKGKKGKKAGKAAKNKTKGKSHKS